MSSIFLWAFLFEIMAVMFLVWGIANEQKLINFERKIGRYFKFYVKAIKQAVKNVV